jgi:hypothetical protein
MPGSNGTVQVRRTRLMLSISRHRL